jgi:hypothetical protein
VTINHNFSLFVQLIFFTLRKLNYLDFELEGNTFKIAGEDFNICSEVNKEPSKEAEEENADVVDERKSKHLCYISVYYKDKN